MTRDDAASAELLHSIAHLYMGAGQNSRALVFLLIANRIDPTDLRILRALAAALIKSGSLGRALGVIEKLADQGDHISAQLLRARALWLLGRQAEARRCFRDYLELRTAS